MKQPFQVTFVDPTGKTETKHTRILTANTLEGATAEANLFFGTNNVQSVEPLTTDFTNFKTQIELLQENYQTINIVFPNGSKVCITPADGNNSELQIFHVPPQLGITAESETLVGPQKMVVEPTATTFESAYILKFI